MATDVPAMRLLDRRLTDLLARATAAQHRGFALACAELAVRQCALSAKIVDTALRTIRELARGRSRPTDTLRENLKALVAELDEKSVEFQDDHAAGKGDIYLRASQDASNRARAAECLIAALSDDPLAAAADSALKAACSMPETDALPMLMEIANRALAH